MTDYHWHQTREDAIAKFAGETPGADLEQFVIDAFLDRPQQVIRAIDHVAQRHTAGKITSSCWGVLRAQLREQATKDIVVSDSSERGKKITRAENWMRTCGIHFDRPTEVDDELFGDRGILRTWASDESLRARMTDLWHELRPIGIRIERQHLVHLGQKRIIAARAARLLKRYGEPEPRLDGEPRLSPTRENARASGPPGTVPL